MLKKAEGSVIGLILAAVAGFSTLAIAPWAAYDPINLPKLLVISLGGFTCIALLLTQGHLLFNSKYRVISFITCAFVIDLSLVLIFAGKSFSQEFYGAHGRATGFVSYLALTGLFLAGVISSSAKNLRRVAHALVATGFLSTLYGTIQAFGADPVNWVNRQSPVIGFLGNPNFQSSFVALSAVMAFSLLFEKKRPVTLRLLLLAYQPLALFVVKESKAQQGFLVLIGGATIVVLIFISKSKFFQLTKPMILVSLLGATLTVLGSLNKGPLAALLHKDSVIYRGDYWQAGWKMTTTHPIFGVGLDSYGDWYQRSRTLAASLRRGADITSDSAHNVLLDISSGGGFPLLVIYIAFLALVIKSARNVLRRNKSFDAVFVGLLAVWAGYQAQSVISLNQLGLAVWGWTLSGLIIGWDIAGSNEVEVSNFQKEKRRGNATRIPSRHSLTPLSVIAIFLGASIGLLIAIPPLSASINYKNARESGRVQILIDSAYKKPYDVIRMSEIAVILSENNFKKESLNLLNQASKEFPDFYGVWALKTQMPGVPQNEILEAKAQMKRLDPLNPDLK